MAGSSKVRTTLDGVRATVFPSAGLVDFSTLCADAGLAPIARPAMARTAAARVAASSRHPIRGPLSETRHEVTPRAVPLERRTATTAVATPATPTSRPPMPSAAGERVGRRQSGLAAVSPVLGAGAASICHLQHYLFRLR